MHAKPKTRRPLPLAKDSGLAQPLHRVALALRRVLVVLAITSALAMPSTTAFAVQPDEVLKNPKLESRARALSAHLRCLVCQNQSIDDSDAGLARDLRVLVRERLVAGDSDSEVLDFVVARYGEFVLLKPVWAPHTYLLWLAPLLILMLAGVLARNAFRSAATGPAPQSPGETTAEARLSNKEESRLARILSPDKSDGTEP